LLDTCSSVSLVSSRYITSEIHPLPRPVTITGITNHSIKVLGWTTIFISFPNLPDIRYNLYVLENFKYDILLGNDFLAHYKVIIN